MKFISLLAFLLAPGFALSNEFNAVEKTPAAQEESLHAEPWAFGHSPDRKAPIWEKGRAGKTLLPKGKKASSRKGDAGQEERKRVKSSLGLSYQEDSGTWKVTPSQKDIRPDENRVRENKHILGAYADVEAGDDFKIKVGPELIIRDDTQGDQSAYTDQPDSSIGLGMKFKYDF